MKTNEEDEELTTAPDMTAARILDADDQLRCGHIDMTPIKLHRPLDAAAVTWQT